MKITLRTYDDVAPTAATAGAGTEVHQWSRTGQWRVYIGVLVASDLLLSILAFLAATWVRFNLTLPIFNLTARPTVPSWGVVLVVIMPLWILLFATQGLYQRRNLLGGLQEYSGVFRAASIGILLIVITGFLNPLANPARGWIGFAWLFAVVFVITGRFILRRVVYALRRKGLFMSPTLIVGINSEAASLAEQFSEWRTSGLNVIGFICENDDAVPSTINGLPVVGTLADLELSINQYNIEELVIASSALTQDQILDVFKVFGIREGLNLRLSTGLFEIITTGLDVKEIASVPLVRVNHAQLTGTDWFLKSVMDIALSVIFLLICWPLLIAIGMSIKADSPGPIFYRRRVLGLRGKYFDAFKFRTMATNGDDILANEPELLVELQTNHKLKVDPRITRVGQFLRKTSLDELPQFWNVIRREMSVVGPRMISPEELVMYDKWDVNLLTVRPGITGLWQVSGRSEVSYSERVQLDMRYIRNWSILLDIQIILRTIIVVLKGTGAY